MMNNINIVSSFTVDKYERYERPGGPALFSTVGIVESKANPKIVAGIGKDFKFKIKLLEKFGDTLILGDSTFTFQIHLLPDGRKNVKLLKRGPLINSLKVSGSGVLLNPVCREIDTSLIRVIDVPIAIDIQGFSRSCREGSEVSLATPELPMSRNYFVLHGNSDEIYSIYDNINALFRAGFREIIISYGREGFEVVTSEAKTFHYTPAVIGNNEVGNGDFLIGSYFSLRISGVSIEEAVKRSGQLSDKFSNENIFQRFVE